jgi:tRNA pseudouridine55 synthase
MTPLTESLNGLLLIDKPAGPTSHDVVARARRALGERRIGHTGTLDPSASGLLPLVVGPATRLARFLSGADKTYDVEIRLGVATDTGDADGVPTTVSYTGPWPDAAMVERVLDAFRGTYLQQPPAFSAKKVAGRRSYASARAARGQRAVAGASTPSPADAPRPVPVTVTRLALLELDGPRLHVAIDCSAGFYVRAVAHDIGERLGTGAHVTALRRTRSGTFQVAAALPLARVEADPDAARAALLPPAAMLGPMPGVALTDAGVQRALHGQDIRPADAAPGTMWPTVIPQMTRLLSPQGTLVGLAEPSTFQGLLHPCVVLG